MTLNIRNEADVLLRELARIDGTTITNAVMKETAEWLDARRIDIRETGSPRLLLGYAVAAAEKHGIARRYHAASAIVSAAAAGEAAVVFG